MGHWVHILLGSRHRRLSLRRRRRWTSLFLLLNRRTRAKLPGPALAVSLGVHKEVAIAIEIVPYTRRPSFCLTLEAEIWIFQLQRTVYLLQRHRIAGFCERIKDEHCIVIWWLGQILWAIRRFWWIVGRWRA